MFNNNTYKDKNLILFIYYKSAFSGYNFKRKYIENKFRNKGYEVMLIRHSNNLFEVIEKYKSRIVSIFLHTSIYRIAGFSWFKNSKHNNFQNFLDFFENLKEEGINIQPKLKMREMFDTKKYSYMFENEYPELCLKGTKTLLFNEGELFSEILPILVCHITKKLKIINKLIIKKGFSSVSRGNVIIDPINSIGTNYTEDELQTYLIKELNNYKIMNSTDYNTYESDIFEINSDRIYIIQPYNEIITSRENEYRLNFVNNKYMGMISHGTDWNLDNPLCYPNILFDKHNALHSILLNLATKVIKFVNDIKQNQIVVRVDISYSIDPRLQDEYSCVLQDEMRRYYINEIELTPALYFECSRGDIKYQNKVINQIVTGIIHDFENFNE